MHLAQKLKGDSPSANGDGLGTQYFSFEQLSPHRVLSENRGSRACERPVERVLDTYFRKSGAAAEGLWSSTRVAGSRTPPYA